jgi:hypothetical protein
MEESMADPVYFVVERSPEGEQPVIYYDRLPQRLSGKNATRDGLIYAVRMDVLPNAAKWMSMSLAELYRFYCEARDNKTLPPRYVEPMKASSEPAKRLEGQRRQSFERPWADLPAEPFPTVAELYLRARKARQQSGHDR